MTAGLIADDLTGALDAGAGFFRSGLRAALPFSGLPGDAPEADVVLVNTDTREGTAAAAARITREAAERLKTAGIRRVYKKIDSVLRGHPGEELAAVLDVYGGRAAVAPAFPAQGRVTRTGVQYAHGQPVAPYGGFLRDALGRAAARADVFDAGTDEELERVAAGAAARAEYRVWCGTAGLAAHLPAAWDLRPAHGPVPAPLRANHVVVLAGTGHAVTNTQLDALHTAALPAVTVGFEGRRYWDAGASKEDVGAALVRIVSDLHLEDRGGLILTGGETAMFVCRALGALSIEVTGEALPGIPTGILHLPDCDVPVATKSGGFGAPDALVTITQRMLGAGS